MLVVTDQGTDRQTDKVLLNCSGQLKRAPMRNMFKVSLILLFIMMEMKAEDVSDRYQI